MIAFVLGGGGNLGALQVGALQVLHERGIRPDLLVGSSVGAINAAYLAEDPGPESPHRLADVWLAVRKDRIYPGNVPSALWRLVRRSDSLYPATGLRDFLGAHLPRPSARFGDVLLPLFVGTTDLHRGRLHLFGDNAEDSVLDALLASVAFPPYLPPVRHGGALLVDGGVAASLPIGVAVEKGVTEVYALDVREGAFPAASASEPLAITYRALTTLLEQQAERDRARWAEYPGLRVRHLLLQAPRHLAFDDFGHSAELIAEGRRAAERFLDERGSGPAPAPPPARTDWR